MSGTPEGGRKTRDAMLAIDPDFYMKIGKIGGKIGKTGGFYHSKATGSNAHVEAGRKGGYTSRPPARAGLRPKKKEEGDG